MKALTKDVVVGVITLAITVVTLAWTPVGSWVVRNSIDDKLPDRVADNLAKREEFQKAVAGRATLPKLLQLSCIAVGKDPNSPKDPCHQFANSENKDPKGPYWIRYQIPFTELSDKKVDRFDGCFITISTGYYETRSTPMKIINEPTLKMIQVDIIFVDGDQDEVGFTLNCVPEFRP
ncbi:MAG: hypothetical protein U1E87_07515 [Alphaproteobacteria bacterium]